MELPFAHPRKHYTELENNDNAGGPRCSGSSNLSFPRSGSPFSSIGRSRPLVPKPPSASNQPPRASCGPSSSGSVSSSSRQRAAPCPGFTASSGHLASGPFGLELLLPSQAFSSPSG